MEAIQTYYNGYHFRSRLEARWAVFFDALGVKYEYEPEGFDLGDGLYYLPDFRVKCYGLRGDYGSKPFDLYIEVKGHMSALDEKKIWAFATGGNMEGKILNSVLVVDKIPPHGNPWDSCLFESYDPIGERICPFNYETIDGDMFAAYPAATRDGKFYLWGDESSYIIREDVDRVIRAYDCARMARFEHGEHPTLELINEVDSLRAELKECKSLERSVEIIRKIERIEKYMRRKK